MDDYINKNYFLVIEKDGKIIETYYANSTCVINELKKKHKGASIDVYDIKGYEQTFGPAPTIRVDGCRISGVKCRETGKTWLSVKACCREIGMPLKTLYSAIQRGNRVMGYHFDYYNGL